MQAEEDVRSARDLLERADAAAKSLTEKARNQTPCAHRLNASPFVSCDQQDMAKNRASQVPCQPCWTVGAVCHITGVGRFADGAVQGGVEGRGATAR
jgi:hypothetical protein